MPESPRMMLMPAKAGTCVHCATVHGEHDPHNLWSVFYGMRFKMKWGRDPTHADCAAHLSGEIQQRYRIALTDCSHEWSEPEGAAVREPYVEAGS